MTKLSILISFLSIIGIYDFKVTSVNNQLIDFSTFSGKKILIVNTASQSKYAAQYADLEMLYQQYKDSLVVIAVPSNSFNDEPLSTIQIDSLVHNTYHVHYPITSLMSVKGVDQHSLYKWLTDSSRNGMMSAVVKGSFQKYLISETGQLIGVFSPSVNPLSEELVSVVRDAQYKP